MANILTCQDCGSTDISLVSVTEWKCSNSHIITKEIVGIEVCKTCSAQYIDRNHKHYIGWSCTQCNNMIHPCVNP